MSSIVWFGGRLVQDSSALISILSPTSQYGLNVFEGIRGYYSVDNNDIYIFRLTDHLLRLSESCSLLGLSPAFALTDIKNSIKLCIEANSFAHDISIRCSIYLPEPGSWSSSGPIDYLIAPILKKRSSISELQPVKCCISSWQRLSPNSSPPAAKVGSNYMNSRLAFLDAQSSGFDQPIFLDHLGHVCESSGSCVFIVKNNTLLTAPVSSSILPSITRDTVLTMASALGIPTLVQPLTRTDLYLADEAFLCGSAVEILPIDCIDRFKLKSISRDSLTIKILHHYLLAVSGLFLPSMQWNESCSSL